MTCDRAQVIVYQLQAEGVKGTSTVSVSTTFDIRTCDESAEASVPFDQQMTSSTGKPLTTVTITFTVPPTA